MLHRRGRGFVAVLALAGVGFASPAAIPKASAAPLAGAHASAVISGDARFEVLSPTLIRTEYAGDAHFTDADTFNAIGRDNFAPARFSAQTVAGWLTIRTQAMTLRYK